MAFQTIRLKNTNVVGKIPTAEQLDVAELVIQLKDHKLFSKDADGNVFELSGSSVGTGSTPPATGNETGDLFWDGTDLLIFNGTAWEEVSSDPPAPPVTSVNSKVGDVVLVLDDIDDVNVSAGISCNPLRGSSCHKWSDC